MSINLYSFVEHPFTDKAYFNYDKFKDVVYKAQRLMDDIVDLEEEKINQILNKIENDPEPEEIKAIEKNLWLKIKQKLLDGRRTGLSAIGLADCFAAISNTYASNSSIELAEEIYKQFAISAYKSSIDMSGERGAFPMYDYTKEKENPFLKRLGKDEKGGELGKYSRRNIALLTIPPSGTISLLAGISSGIEPVYQLYYKRRRKLEKGNPKITFADQNGDGWEEYVVLHPKFKEWLDTDKRYSHSVWDYWNQKDYEEAAKDSPYHNSTAYEIDPLQRVKLQATIQKWIDHSISSTINLPEGTTEETVSNLYMEAWKQGCKGLTIYVDECRTGVLISNNNNSLKKFKQHDAPKRPKELEAEFHKIKVKGTEYGVLIGLMENKPYEIIA
jgi:ribonucleoside-diphosphate reductase alpha chain